MAARVKRLQGGRKCGRPAKHSGKSPWFNIHHFDVNYRGPTKGWMNRQEVGVCTEKFDRDLLPGNVMREGQTFFKTDRPAPGQEPRVPAQLADLAAWPSLAAGSSLGKNATTAPGSTPNFEFITFCGAEGGKALTLAATHNEKEGWVCLSPKPLYSDTVKSAGEENHDACSTTSSSTVSRWMLVDGDDDFFEGDQDSCSSGPFLYEEEIVITDDKVKLEPLAKPVFHNAWSNTGQLFFEEY